ncbi:zinc-dependent alcohol dehydrogenase family protein [Paenibacillus sp. HB172176]|uniref:zinc-dependent alcohol dehydrogenase family protein n=1 Tax=Paenibacillus sp. HB172176 TaxID=2493690 RepID=UPI00143B8A50|nr:zinc-dependent alcohol dehydrogenase family protein [Paenibacillus sp. HB172176]
MSTTLAFPSLRLTSPGHMSIAEQSLPKLREHEVLVKVAACGICGTDRHIYHGSYPATLPVVPGHEFAGHIEALGSGVANVEIGQFVTINPNIWCRHCQACLEGRPHLCSNMQALGVNLDGGMSLYCVVPEQLLYNVLPMIDPLKACLAEPISCVLHGLDRLEIKAGTRAAVFGGGFIGQLMLQAIQLQGATEVILVEPQAHKRQVANELGFATIDPFSEPSMMTKLKDLDFTVDCAGAGGVLTQCVNATKPGGDVLLFAAYPQGKALPIEPYEIFRKELRLIGTFTYPDTQLRAIRLIEKGAFELDSLITAVSLEEVQDYLEGLRDDEIIKAVVKL